MAIKNLKTRRKTAMVGSQFDRFAQHWLFAYCCSLVFFSVLMMPFPTHAIDKKQQLETIQQSIAKKEKSVLLQKQQKNELQDQLKLQTNTIVLADRALQETQITLTRLNKDIALLTQSMQKLRAKQLSQQNVLAKQLDATFRQGRYNGWQLLFNNEASQRRERILVWFSHLNQARHESIAKLKQTRAELATQTKILLQKQNQQKILLAEQQTQRSKLEQVRAERKKNLSTLETSLREDQLTLAELQQNEAGLRDKIIHAEHEAEARAKPETEESPKTHATVKTREQRKPSTRYTPGADELSLMELPDGLGKPNGQATWPLHGSVVHHFGEALQGELRWKGMVISAPEGTKVKAIADGNVLLADWLQGYGSVVVIEHGTSDMSVYGYNKKVLVNVGASVKAGQPIALVGDSGGQGYPALYLEIRRQGLVVNPQPWLGK